VHLSAASAARRSLPRRPPFVPAGRALVPDATRSLRKESKFGEFRVAAVQPADRAVARLATALSTPHAIHSTEEYPMIRALRLGVLSAALALVAGCVHVHPPQTQAPPAAGAAAAAKPPEAKPATPFKPWDEILKDTRAVDGLFRMHVKRDNTLFVEVKPSQLDKDFGMGMHFSRGVGVFNVHQGLPLSDMMLMRWRRSGDKLYLVRMNPRFTAAEGSPMRTSLDGNVGHSVLAAFAIQSEHAETKALVVDATPFFVSDYPNLGEGLKWSYGSRPVTFDRDRSFVDRVQGFPKNVEIDAALTYRATDFPTSTSVGVSDYRSIPIGVRYSLIELPEQPMQRRLADARVGHFLDAVRDFSRDRDHTPMVRYVTRWRLEKKDPNAAMSEPVQPIVYYIDHTVPHEYRKYVKEGIEGWNKAFEKAGFKNAIVAKEAPNDSTWSAEDMRYSTVRWTAAHQMGYAIGPSQTDPRTGEILNADVLISSTFVTSWQNSWQNIAGPEGMIEQHRQAERMLLELPAYQAARMCLAEMGKSHQLGMKFATLAGLGVIDGTGPMPEEFLGDAIRDLVLHEVGHTIGLRHNFKGSSAIPYDKLHDKDFTRKNGLSLSVMDYAPVNLHVDPKRQGHYWNVEVGAYDMWAIQYAYAPIYEQSPSAPFAYSGTLAKTPEAELVGLRKIASQASSPLHAYNTDEDAHLGPMAIDPLSNVWDLGSDPMRFARDRAEIVARIKPRIEQRLIADGDSYARLRGAVNGLLFEQVRSLLPVTKTVGGIYFSRDHKGDPEGRPPFTPVSAAKQREAVKLIVDNAFAPGSFKVDPAMLNKMAPNRFSDWSGGWFAAPIDFPIHATVGSMQQWLLEELLDNGRLARMVDNTVRMPGGAEAYTVAELFSSVGGAIWMELGEGGRAPRNVDSFRRNLQRAHLDQMSRIMLNLRPFPWVQPAPEDARSLARYELVELGQRIDRALAAGGSIETTTRAHLLESKARIDKAIETSYTVAPR
jgi:hypothetical protein